MSEPQVFLLFAAGVIAIGYFLFRPGYGYVWRSRQFRRMNKRVLIEDALKHLYDCEYQELAPTVQSISGALEISGDNAAELLGRLQTLRLLKSEGERFQLTPDGRDYALRVIRMHRLWERYLSDETGVKESQWHGMAERQEHAMSPVEADELAAQMGNPVYDPHGDPIPTASGDIAPQRGHPLTALSVGESATIVHIEDEPDAVYAQLVAEGLNPGMKVLVSEISPERSRFWADGDEYVLAPVVAANISVIPLPRNLEMEGPFDPLSTLIPGEKATVVRISGACRGIERRRLLDLGITPGTIVEAEMISPSGDPTAYRIRDTTIALRKEQSNQIHISREKGAS